MQDKRNPSFESVSLQRELESCTIQLLTLEALIGNHRFEKVGTVALKEKIECLSNWSCWHKSYIIS